MKLPYPGYLWTVTRNSFLMWVLVRLMFVVALWPLMGLSAAVHQPTWGIPALLVWFDRRQNHEQLLHANLGTSELCFWGASLLTVCGLDLVAQALLLSL